MWRKNNARSHLETEKQVFTFNRILTRLIIIENEEEWTSNEERDGCKQQQSPC